MAHGSPRKRGVGFHVAVYSGKEDRQQKTPPRPPVVNGWYEEVVWW